MSNETETGGSPSFKIEDCHEHNHLLFPLFHTISHFTTFFAVTVFSLCSPLVKDSTEESLQDSVGALESILDCESTIVVVRGGIVVVDVCRDDCELIPCRTFYTLSVHEPSCKEEATNHRQASSAKLPSNTSQRLQIYPLASLAPAHGGYC